MPPSLLIESNSFSEDIRETIESLYHTNVLSDVTIVSSDKVKFQAHKVVLFSGSTLFRHLLLDNPQSNPILFLSGLNKHDVEQILQYLYLGQTRVPQNDVETFFKKAEEFEIIGLQKSTPEKTKDMNLTKQELLEQNPRKVKSIELNSLRELAKMQPNKQIIQTGPAYYKTEEKEIDRATDSEEVSPLKSNPVFLNWESQAIKEQEDRIIRIHESRNMDKCSIKGISDIIIKEHWDRMKDSEKKMAMDQLKFAEEYEPQIVICRQCRIVFNRDELCTHPYGLKTNLNDEFQCQNCSYVSPRRDTINEHLMKKHIGAKYKCDLCKFKSNRIGDWKKHRVLKHAVESALEL